MGGRSRKINRKGRTSNYDEKIQALLSEWLGIVDQYVKLTEVDTPWFYTERADVSLLAAAAWQNKMVALEEFSIKRTSQDMDKKSGRCDLYIYDGDSLDIFAEAKKFWINISEKNYSKNINNVKHPNAGIDVEKKIASVIMQLNSMDADDYVGRRAGIMFVTPVIYNIELIKSYSFDPDVSLDYWYNYLNNIYNKYEDSLLENYSVHCAGYHLKAKRLNADSVGMDEKNDGKYSYFPGVLMLFMTAK